MTAKMKLLRKFRLVFISLFIVLVLIGVRTLKPSGFRYDARKLAGSSFDGTNLLTVEKMSILEGRKLLVDLDGTYSSEKSGGPAVLKISPDSVLDHAFLLRLRKNGGPVILYSSDEGMAAKIWMLIAQTGVSKLYILLPQGTPELIKNEFRPDTLSGPEL